MYQMWVNVTIVTQGNNTFLLKLRHKFHYLTRRRRQASQNAFSRTHAWMHICTDERTDPKCNASKPIYCGQRHAWQYQIKLHNLMKQQQERVILCQNKINDRHKQAKYQRTKVCKLVHFSSTSAKSRTPIDRRPPTTPPSTPRAATPYTSTAWGSLEVRTCRPCPAHSPVPWLGACFNNTQ